MKNRKNPGEDKFTSEVLKVGGDVVEEIPTVLSNICLNNWRIQESWQNAEIILLFKKGGNRIIENCRPISIFLYLFKLLSKILTNRLTSTLDD